ncbi:hypothetical protein [Corynebacterium variabile]|uniref:hypothetical protein n=1 Tax=Corynebacterium variabile TaxID=1727 RepID=UPI003A8E3A4E
MANLNLYDLLGISPDTPPTTVGTDLDTQINNLRAQGYADTSGELDQLLTARAILGDPYKRDTYDAALAGPDGVVTVDWLHNLADQASYAPAAGAAAAAPSAAPTQYDSPFPTGGSAASGVQYPSQPANAGGSSLGAPVGAQPGGAGKTDLSTTGRTRTDSKMYMAFIVVILVGTLYPLFQLFFGDDYGAGMTKSFYFIVTHTIAWIAIAELAWRIRTIFMSN